MKKIYTTLLTSLFPAAMMAQGWLANYGGVMLQGFYWDSLTLEMDKTRITGRRVVTIFQSCLIPQSASCGGTSMGYDDLYWFTNYNSSFGTEAELRSLISTFKNKGIGTIADVVINHRKTLNSWVDFPSETYKAGLRRIPTAIYGHLLKR